MKIINFTRSHMEEAQKIAIRNYEEERQLVPILPRIFNLPELIHFADNNLGVVALDGDKMVGFLCAYLPLEDAFGTTNAKGTFSPIHAHGVIGENRDRIYSKLYQAAAEKWVSEGIVSHAIALYTHDKASINSFFYNGFGLRCIDAIRPMEELPTLTDTPMITGLNLEYCEVPRKEWGRLLEQHNALITHLGCSPTFMRFPQIDEEELYKRTSEEVRYFAAKKDGQYIAYIKIDTEGENFVTEDSSMMNICGAYCNSQYRGTGIYRNLLLFLIIKLKAEGYTRLGVDCESFNPNARGFWLKYFTEYTHSVVRRIDDKAGKGKTYGGITL